MVLVAGAWLFAAAALIVTLTHKITWLTYLYYFSYIKLGVTLIKYIPQVSVCEAVGLNRIGANISRPQLVWRPTVHVLNLIIKGCEVFVFKAAIVVCRVKGKCLVGLGVGDVTYCTRDPSCGNWSLVLSPLFTFPEIPLLAPFIPLPTV